MLAAYRSTAARMKIGEENKSPNPAFGSGRDIFGTSFGLISLISRSLVSVSSISGSIKGSTSTLIFGDEEASCFRADWVKLVQEARSVRLPSVFLKMIPRRSAVSGMG